MKVSFEFDARLVLTASVCGLIAVFALHVAYPRLLDYWPKTSSDLAAWIQAGGTVAAIAAAIWVSHEQDRRNKLATEAQVRLLVASMDALGREFASVLDKNPRIDPHELAKACNMRANIFDEYVRDFRSLSFTHLAPNWTVAVTGLRAVAIQTRDSLRESGTALDNGPLLVVPYYCQHIPEVVDRLLEDVRGQAKLIGMLHEVTQDKEASLA